MRNLIGIVALSLLAAVAGCAADDISINDTTSTTSSDPENPFASTEGQALRFPQASCTVDTTGAIMTVSMASVTVPIVITKRVVDSAITINGTNCGLASKIKQINVNGTAGADTVVIDYSSGLFSTGTAAASTTSINVDLGAGANKFGIKGTTGADVIAMGQDATITTNYFVKMNADAFPDVNIIKGSNSMPTTTVYLGAGNDTFTAGNFGNAIAVYGGAGNDVFNQSDAKTPSETIDGGSGNDTVSYSQRTAVITALVGTNLSDSGDATATAEADRILNTVETLIGGTGNDILTGDPTNATVLNGGLGDDRLTGGGGNDSLLGGAGNDSLLGAAGADTLSGDAGNDSLTGGDGADILNGGDGDDTFAEGSTDTNGADVFNGGAGVDLVDYSLRATTGVLVTMDGASANDGADTDANTPGAEEGDNVKADVENINGSTLADNITGNALGNTISGGTGNDVLTGLGGDDTFYEWAGCTLVAGLCSVVTGEAANGNDTIAGGVGVDTVNYARFTLVTVVMDGTTASGETVTIGEADIIGTDVENCLGGAGDDLITGNANDNYLSGGIGADSLVGLDGDDELDGGDGSDADTITGGNGVDICYGTSGSPTTCEI